METDQKNCSSASSRDFMRMSSIRLTDGGVVDQLALDHDVNQSELDSTLYRSAANGKIDDFKDNKDLLLDQLLTPNKNTILHIHITSAKTDEKANAKTEFVEEILKLCPALLLQTNAKGETPLHLAARYGHRRIVELLIERAKAGHEDLESGNQAAKEMLRATNEANDTALHEAVRFRHLQVVRILTKEDPDFSYSANKSGETPLYIAAERGYRKLLSEILNNCSSPARDGPNNRTVLHAVTIAGDKEMTREVLGRWSTTELTRKADDQVWIPLHHVAYDGYAEIVKLLVEHDKCTAYMKDKEGMTALHVAAYRGYDKAMKEIISCCPDSCELVDNKGQNVLHHAVDGGWEGAVKVILDDYSLSNLLNEKDIHGNTPLLHGVTSFKGNVDLIQHPRVDRMAFNNQNQNSLDIISRLHTGDNIEKQDKERRLKKLLGLRSTLRMAVTLKRDAAGWEKTLEDYFGTVLREGTPGLLVAATLIATVTFAAGFTLPGGLVSNEGPLQGSAILRSKASFKAFMIADTIALVFSTVAVFAIMFLILHLSKSRKLIYYELSFYLTSLAMAAMVIAFVAGTYAVLEHSTALAATTCFIGLCFFILAALLSGIYMYPILKNMVLVHSYCQ